MVGQFPLKRIKSQPRIFYVYVFFRPDTGQPCYVGKGHAGRWLYKKHTNRHLQALLKKFGDLIRVKARQELTEAEAFEIEVAWIKAIGRRDLGTGPLVNQTAGGEGVKDLPKEVLATMSRKTAERMRDPVRRERSRRWITEYNSRPEVKEEDRKRMLRLRVEPGSPLYAPRTGHKGAKHKAETLAVMKSKALIRMEDPKLQKSINENLMLGRLISSEKRSEIMLAHYESLRQQGLSTGRPAKDEPARRLAVKAGMLEYRARVRDIELGDDIQ